MKKKVDLKYNKNFKYIMSILCLTLILIISLLSPKLVKAYSSEDKSKKTSIYMKVINYAMPTVSIANSDDTKSPKLKESFFKKIGFKKNQSKSSLIKDSDEKENKTCPKDVNSVIDPFELDEKEVSKNIENDGAKKNINSPAYQPKLKKKLDMNKPEVLIYHTHTHESYKPGSHTSDNQKVNICSVGDVLTEELMQNYGICVIHDKTFHDNVYTKCYTKSGQTVDRYLKKYGDFKLIIDLHRDSAENKKIVTTKLNGEQMARYMFVIDQSNPLLKNTMSLTNKLISISDRLYPNLLRKTKIYTYRHGCKHFHQNKSKNLIVLEVGSHMNTTDEAKRTAKYIARIIAEYMNGNK